MDWTWYLFRFDGRINRAKFWAALLIVMFGMIMLGGLAAAVGIVPRKTTFSLSTDDLFRVVDPASYRSWSWSWTGMPSLLVKVIATSLFLWVYFALSIKRLHDRDKSGWWMVPFFILPGLYDQFADRLPDSYFMMVPALIGFGLYFWGFIEICFLRGSSKTNRFGPDPLAPPPRVDTRPPWDQHSEIEIEPHKGSPPPTWRVKPGYE
jgi:uncharacterized membrane protein YhaH (DUF805 family)